MKKDNHYTEMGLRALKRAAGKVHEDARKNNYKIPVWKNGRIEYVIPGVNPDSDDITRKAHSKPFAK